MPQTRVNKGGRCKENITGCSVPKALNDRPQAKITGCHGFCREIKTKLALTILFLDYFEKYCRGFNSDASRFFV